ncbi:hypothetical protein GGF46_003874 [Coemansia sp. RSA 552]|nr:hypothetical protein GGF46_003874 [Coemansia sp. RSA 552]
MALRASISRRSGILSGHACGALAQIQRSVASSQAPRADAGALRSSAASEPIGSPTESTESQTQRLARLPVVRDMDSSNATVREEFHWPMGKRAASRAPDTLIYGALSGAAHFPTTPIVFSWAQGQTPAHLDPELYRQSWATAEQRQQAAEYKVPGISVVQYVGPGLGFTGTTYNHTLRKATAHPGVPASLLDNVTARIGVANAAGKPLFTANFQLDYTRPVPTDSFVVMDAWITKIEGRKTFITSSIADAVSNRLLVSARSLFISAA